MILMKIHQKFKNKRDAKMAIYVGPCPRESYISPYRLEALRLHQKIVFEERATVKICFLKIGKSQKCPGAWNGSP